MRKFVAVLLALALMPFLMSESVFAFQPDCYSGGKPGTCFPSVNQCQSCCVGDACTHPTSKKTAKASKITVAPKTQAKVQSTGRAQRESLRSGSVSTGLPAASTQTRTKALR
jgi:hypothetical protein